MDFTPQVYLIDDRADYRFLVQQIFSRHLSSYTLSLFSDGRFFLDKLAQLDQLPNLILLDRHMPNLDGHQTLLLLKAHPVYKKIPVVMMSDDASIPEINGCYEGGANSFLRKSITLDSLKDQMSLVCHYWLEHNQRSVEMV